jgi:hypothetical protein
MSMRDKIAKALTGIKAYHSSPHDFDRFDLSKIGTGEGAQSYGHGIYAAENPAVSGQGGQYWESFLNHPSLTPGQQHAGSRLRAEGFDKEKAIAATQRDVNDWMNPEAFPGRDLKNDPYAQKMLALRQAELEALQNGKAGPRTYELNINADPAQMLDWDKPLREQQNIADIIRANPRSMDEMKGPIRRKAEAVYGGNIPADISGSDAYTLMNGYRDPARASAALNEAGIPGIKYLDQGSRQHAADITNAENVLRQNTGRPSYGAWEEELARLKQTPVSSNYVVFDPSIIDITKKYAVPGAIGAGTMGSLASQDQYGVAP